jgi:hypothetical protein
LAVNTIASACSTPAVARPGGNTHSILINGPITYKSELPPPSTFPVFQSSMAMAGLLLVGLLGRSSRRLGTVAGICLLAAVGITASGCATVGSSPPPSGASPAAKGSYTVTIVGTDTASASITASTITTLTVN